MKKENSFLGRLFRATDHPTEMGRPSPVTITSYSQPNVLQQRMREEHMTHGETVTANISPVRLESAYGRMVLYFCPMKSIEVVQVLNSGDGGSIPDDATVEELNVPDGVKGGYYTLKNVILTSNGTMQVRGTKETVWEEVHCQRF
jgi:hypothetical protein